MPSFKHKTNKKIYVDKKRIMTLDGVHRELQLEFNLINNITLPELINRKNEIMKRLNNTTIPIDINERIELQDSLYDIKNDISKNKKKNKRLLFEQ